MTQNQNPTMLQVSPRVLRLLGEKLYESHPLIIVTRELYQNAVDACRNEGGDVTIDIKTGDKTSVTCTDTGIGMSPEVLLNKFLCLGETGKEGNDNVGGFGIAKAAILSSASWEVTTSQDGQTSYISDTTLGQPLNVSPDGKPSGTTVSCVIDRDTDAYDVADAVAYVMLSRVPSTVQVQCTVNGNTINDYNLPSHPCYALTQNEYSIGISTIPAFTRDSNVPCLSVALTTRNVYRLSGLVQFIENAYNTERKSNVIVDFENVRLRPDHTDYPFSMSRENVKWTVKSEIKRRLEALDQDALSTDRRTERRDEQMKWVNPDVWMYPNTHVPAIGKMGYNLDGVDAELLTTMHKRNLRLYAAILTLCARERYRVSVTEDTAGYRLKHDNAAIYGISLTMLDSSRYGMDEYIMRVYALVCHEVTHYFSGTHNEQFTAALTYAFMDYASALLANMPALRSIVRANFK